MPLTRRTKHTKNEWINPGSDNFKTTSNSSNTLEKWKL